MDKFIPLELMKYIPFTYFWHIQRMLGDDIKTILDLGCGKGEFGNIFNKNNRFEITGVDIFKSYLDQCRKKGKYKRLIKSDLRKIKFRNKSFDAVVCLQTIEHLNKKDGESLIKKIEKIAKKLIIITTPVGDCGQESYDDNKYQKHLSSWYPKDFTKESFNVLGVSLKAAYGSHSHASEKITSSKIIPYFISFLLNPLVSQFPSIAAQLVAYKRNNNYTKVTFNTLPFSYSWIFRHHLGNKKSVLDVGCGEGNIMSKINSDNKYNVTGVDLHRPYLRQAKELGAYRKLLYGDIRRLRFKQKSFDAVMSSQVIEHLTKKEGLKLIKVMENIASDKIIIGTTNGFFPYDPYMGRDDNPLQVHKSGWDIKEMENYGYKVYGQGISFIYKPGGLAYKFPSIGIFLFLFSYFLSPLTYIFPEMSSYIIAVKRNV